MILPLHIEQALKMAVDTYAELTGQSFEDIAKQIIDGKGKTFEHVTRIMAAAA